VAVEQFLRSLPDDYRARWIESSFPNDTIAYTYRCFSKLTMKSGLSGNDQMTSARHRISQADLQIAISTLKCRGSKTEGRTDVGTVMGGRLRSIFQSSGGHDST